MREQVIAHKVGNRSGMASSHRSAAVAQRPTRRESGGERVASRLRSLLGYVPTVLKLVLALVFGGLIFLGYRAAASASFFEVRRVEVQGTARVSADEIEGLVRREAGQTGVWNADLTGISTQLERLPWVRNAVVSRVLPDGIRVRIVERVPRAVVRTASGRFRWVDEDAVLLGEMLPTDQIPAFFLRGLNEDGSEISQNENRGRVQKFMELQRDWDAAGLSERVSEVNLIEVRDIRAQLAGDNSQIEVRLGSQDHGKRLKDALDVLDGQRQTPRGSMISYIDLSQGKRAIVGLTSGAHTTPDGNALPASVAEPASPTKPENSSASNTARARKNNEASSSLSGNSKKERRDKRETEKKTDKTKNTAKRRQ